MNTLIIAKDHDLCQCLQAQLVSYGYEVTVCLDAGTALNAYQQTFSGLVLLNCELPDMQSAEFCHHLRALPKGDCSMVLVLTESDQTAQLLATLEAGADDYVVKPVTPELLKARLTLVERQLQRRRQYQQTEKKLASTLEKFQHTEEELRAQNEELVASNDELRQIQQELETSRQKYADLYDFAPIGYCTLNEDGTVLEANLTAARLFGEERSRFIKARFYHFIVENDRERFFLHLRTVGKERRLQTCEIRLIRQDGSEFSAQLDTSWSLESGQHNTRYRTAISDITVRKQMEQELHSYRQHLEELVEKRTHELKNSTEHLQQEMTGRKRADQALRTSEQQYRLLAENVADGIGIIQEGKLVFVNNVLAAMLRYEARQLMETNALDLIHGAYKSAFMKRVQELTEDDIAAQNWQAVFLARDGREVWTESHHRMIDWEGKPALLATVRDITTRKLREQAMEKERAQLRKENVQLRAAIEDRSRFGDMIGKSQAMQEVYAQIVTAAAVDANVLISGESGTGKELAARTIHQLSHRKTQEFVAVNCGAIPENLFEREFFGHHKGAFTGAEKDTPGLFDRAHTGTLFLDEVGELSAIMQVKLLRVLENGEYTPVGQNRPRKVDVRLIAATNKDLESLVKQGLMRDDFFYRIHVLVITMPPLRQHPEDIPLLIDDFLHRYYNANAEPRPAIPEQIIAILSQYKWSGNVRELYNVLHRYLQEHRLTLSDTRQITSEKSEAVTVSEFFPNGLTFREAVKAYEARLIATALQQHHNNAANAAKSLGMPLRTLYRKIEKYHLVPQ